MENTEATKRVLNEMLEECKIDNKIPNYSDFKSRVDVVNFLLNDISKDVKSNTLKFVENNGDIYIADILASTSKNWDKKNDFGKLYLHMRMTHTDFIYIDEINSVVLKDKNNKLYYLSMDDDIQYIEIEKDNFPFVSIDKKLEVFNIVEDLYMRIYENHSIKDFSTIDKRIKKFLT
jgi:hypothetical protein